MVVRFITKCNGYVINYILSPKVLGTKLTTGKGKNAKTVFPALVDPLAYYLGTLDIVE
jgi:hypothetical protein